MSELNSQALLEEMLGAARSVFKEQWPFIEDFARPEFEKLVATVIQIQILTQGEQIGEGEAAVFLEMQKTTARSVLMSREGTGMLKVEQAINASLGMVKNTVNTTLGFPLI